MCHTTTTVYQCSHSPNRTSTTSTTSTCRLLNPCTPGDTTTRTIKTSCRACSIAKAATYSLKVISTPTPERGPLTKLQLAAEWDESEPEDETEFEPVALSRKSQTTPPPAPHKRDRLWGERMKGNY